jgi:hypothetical protein
MNTITTIRPIDLALVEREIADLLGAYPEIAEDEQLRADMVEGSTSISTLLEILLTAERDAADMQGALSSRIEDAKARKDRFKRRQEGAKKMMQRLMEIAGLKRLQLTEATLTVANVPPSVVIIDEFQVPAEFMRVKSEPDKAAIKDALKNGAVIPGCQMSNGGQSLRVIS